MKKISERCRMRPEQTRISLKKQTRPPAYASEKPGGENKQTSIPEQTNDNNAKFHRDETQIRSRQNPNTIGTVFSNKNKRCFFFPYKYSQKKLKQNQKADMTRTSTPKYNKEMYSAMGNFSDITKSELQYPQDLNVQKTL